MQELQEQQKEKQKWRDLLNTYKEPTPQERTEHVRKLQFEKGQGLFAVAYSTLHKAAMDGNVDGLKWFLTGKGRNAGSGGAKISVDDFDACQLSAIHYAAERGHNAAIEFLLKRKSKVNCKSGNGNTAMHYAAKSNNCDTIRLLHSEGGDLLARNMGGMTPSHFCCQVDNIEALKVIKELMDGDLEKASALVEAAAEDGTAANVDRVAPEDKGEENSQNNESVHEQSEQSEEIKAAIALLEHPKLVEIDMPSLNRTRPIHLAASFDSRRCLEYILSFPHLDRNSTDFMGESALHKASRKNFHICYDMLIEAGADNQLHNNMHETPAALMQDEGVL